MLLVVGVRTADSDAAGRQLADLLDAHRYTDGLAFLPAARPRTTRPTSGPASLPEIHGRKPASQPTWLADPVTAGTDAALLGDALGFGPAAADAHLRRVSGADRRDDGLAAAMQTAIWPATWGYYLTQMIGLAGTGLTLDGLGWVRRHAIDLLRPGGALPLLRVGRQPYGVLPVTATGRWQPAPGDAAGPALALRGLLTALRAQVWREASGRVARLGGSDDSSLDVVALLRDTPQSTSLLTRRLMGRTFACYLREFLGEGLDAAGFWALFDQLTAATAAQLGLPTTFVARVAYEPGAAAVTVPLVQDPPADPAQPVPAALSPNYIAVLAGADPDELATPAGAGRVPVLQALLRHSLLREHAAAAAVLLGGASGLVRDPELVDVVPGAAASVTWSGLRARTVPDSTPPTTVREPVAHPRPGRRIDPSARRARRGTGGARRGQPSRPDPTPAKRAGRHRVPARRLDLLAGRSPARRTAEGSADRHRRRWLRLGGEPAAGRSRRTTGGDARRWTASPDRWFEPAEDPGFLFAPSLGQAATAAVLRNAHLAQDETAAAPTRSR